MANPDYQDISLRQIKLFLAVAEAGSLSRAAVLLEIAQPSLSRVIARLERRFSAILFQRHGRGVELTLAGRRLQDHFQAIIRHAEAAYGELRQLSGRIGGECRVAMPNGPGRILFLPLIRLVGELHQDARVRVIESISANIPDLIAAGRADLGVVADTHPLRGLALAPLATEDLHLMGRPADKILQRPTVDFEALADLPLLLTGLGGGIRRIVDEAFAARGLVPEVKLEIDSNEVLLDLVAEGAGYAILPFSAARHERDLGRVACTRIVSPPLRRTLLIAAASAGTLSPLSREIARLIRLLTRREAAMAGWHVIGSHAAEP